MSGNRFPLKSGTYGGKCRPGITDISTIHWPLSTASSLWRGIYGGMAQISHSSLTGQRRWCKNAATDWLTDMHSGLTGHRKGVRDTNAFRIIESNLSWAKRKWIQVIWIFYSCFSQASWDGQQYRPTGRPRKLLTRPKPTSMTRLGRLCIYPINKHLDD